MAKFQTSPTLINQLQISLRKEAGLPSFNPSDHPSPSPSPSILQDAITAVGSNPQALRCTDCHGELLRGSDSIICIYCGRFQHNSRDYPPVSFKSTFGYHWFLPSLSLDGSESVERPTDGDTETGKGQSSVQDEVPLSELLDLQLKWPDEANQFGVENEHGKRSSKLVGVDFEELLQAEESLEHVSSSSKKQVPASDNPKTEDAATFSGQNSLSLFDNENKSVEGDNDEESDWAAEFQSADLDVKADYGSHLNAKHGNLENNSESTLNSHFFSAKDILPKSVHVVDSISKESLSLSKDDDKGFVSVNDASFDWLPAADKQRTTNKGDPPPVDKGDVDGWDDFGVFTGTRITQDKPVSTVLPGADRSGGHDVSDSWNDFTGSMGTGQIQFSNNLEVFEPVHTGANDYDLWGHTGMKKDVNVESTQGVTSDQTDSLGLWSGTSKNVGDSYDLWNDFKSSASKNDNHLQSTGTEVAGDQWAAEGGAISKGLHNFAGPLGSEEQQPDGLEAIVVKNNDSIGDSLALWNDDSTDEWSDFARSNGVSDSKSVITDPLSGAWSDVSALMVTDLNLPQRSVATSAESHTVIEDDTAFGSWSDFMNSGAQGENTSSGTNPAVVSTDKIIPLTDSENLKSAEDKNMHNSWGDFDWSTSIVGQQSNAGGIKPFEDKITSQDLFGFQDIKKESISSPDNQFKHDGATFLDGKLASGSDDAINEWTDYSSSSNAPASTYHGNNANAAFGQQPVKDEPFDAWKFIGSASNKPVAINNTVDKGNTAELKLLSMGNSQFVGANSGLHPDPFQGMLNDHSGSIQVSRTEEPNLIRTETDDADGLEKLDRGERLAEETPDLKSPVVENLISEMHDLSFMLESSLSIPKSGT